jgi:hypothetical protein
VRVWSIGAAVLVHAAAFGALLAMPQPKAAVVAIAPAAEIEIEDLAPAPSAETLPTPAPTTASAGAREGVAHASIVSSGTASGPTGGEPHPGAPPAASGSAEPAPTAQIFAMSPADIGVGGPNPFLPRRDDTPPEGEKKSTVLRDSLRAHDMALGLGPQGPVVEAIRDAAYSSVSPENGKAIFEIHAGLDGAISLVDLVATEGGGWSDAQRVAKEKLASVKLVLPRGAKGAVLRIEVTSKWSMPNGVRKGDSGWGTRSAEEMGNGSPAVVLPDPTNPFLKPRRVVSAHVVGGEIL